MKPAEYLKKYPLYAKVLINLPVEGPFDYGLPRSMAASAGIGKRAWVEFGQRRLIGYIIGISEYSDIKNVKPVLSIIDKEPIVSQGLLDLTKNIADYYLCSWGEALSAAIPSGLKKGKTEIKSRFADECHEGPKTSELKPTPAQAKALRDILKPIDEGSHRVFLLHGVTGSGKTEVYLQAISRVLEKKKSCIVLVPEISLTPQAIDRFKGRFKERVAVFHSRLTEGQKYQQWEKLKNGVCHIVVGARSAIFAPIQDLGLIIVDEEHDTSYKQQDTPRYNAVCVAVMRAKADNAVVILGSATPSLESYYKAKNNEYTLLNLRERIEKRPMPEVRVLDMRHELAERRKRQILFSRLLIEAIDATIKNNQQVILFLNRRGFSTYVNCRKCGYVERCKKCNVALNYHSDKKMLVCHYCNFQKDLSRICPACKESYIDYFGFGTQKVESELHRYFPAASICRMDTDATTKRQSHRMILKDFSDGKTQILIGTQMVAKGHDFPDVTLVGVVSADTALNLPNFRAGERTFQLLTQVAGRAGRGDLPGKVIIQTYVPHHYTILCAIEHDYEGFYKKELALRKELLLEPFSQMVTITCRSYKEERSLSAAEGLARQLLKKRLSGLIELSGPCQDFIYRLRRQFRWNIILKMKKSGDSIKGLKAALKDFRKPSGVIITVDVDPL